jgi:hypothetical protein
MGLGRFSIGTATGAIVATGSANAAIWACRWANTSIRALIERLRVNAVVTGTITTAVPYDLEVYLARNFTVAPSTNATASTLTGNNAKRYTSLDANTMEGVYTLATQAAGMVSTMTNIGKNAGVYKWTASAAGGAGVFYCEADAGGNPSLAEPSAVRVSGVDQTLAAAAASLPIGSYFYGDGDTLGYDTVYVHLAGGTDPDAGATGVVEHWVGAVYDLGTPFARVAGATGTVIGTQFFGGTMVDLINSRMGSEIILAENQGLVIRAPLAGPATGTFRVAINLDWREVGATWI